MNSYCETRAASDDSKNDGAKKTTSEFGSDSSCFLSIVNDYCEKQESVVVYEN